MRDSFSSDKSDRLVLSDAIAVFAFWAYQDRLATLEHRFLSRVVHTGLAKVVHRLSALCVRPEPVNVGVGVQFRELVTLPFLGFSQKLVDLLAKLSSLVFRRAFRLAARKQFLLELETGRLRLDQYPCDFLLRVGDLRVISGGSSCLPQGERSVQSGKCGGDIHGSSSKDLRPANSTQYTKGTNHV